MRRNLRNPFKRRGSSGPRRREGPGMVDATAATFIEHRESRKSMIAMIGASWCGPCKIMRPKVDEAAKLHPAVETVYLSADEPAVQKLCMDFYVRAVPTLLAFHEGEIVDQRAGGGRPGKLATDLDELYALAERGPR